VIPPVIGRVVPGEPAAEAGLQAGDRVLSVDGAPITTWIEWVEHVRAHPGQALTVTLARGDAELTLDVTPERVSDGDTVIGRIGAEVRLPEHVEQPAYGVERYGPAEALPGAAGRTWEMSVTTLKFLGKMITGQASVRNLSGPISIAHYAGESARLGPARFLEFLALVSVSLAVLNLLPIPLLDGGHLLYYLIEFATRKPVSDHLQAYGQQIGLVVLLSLMGLAVYNDILRIL
jgi:regulator of sigma E protease